MALITKWSADHLRELPLQLWTSPGLISTAILLILPRWLPLWQSDWTEPVAGYVLISTEWNAANSRKSGCLQFASLSLGSNQEKPGNIINVSSTVVLMWPLLKQEKKSRGLGLAAGGLVIKGPIENRRPFLSRRVRMHPFSQEKNHE